VLGKEARHAPRDAFHIPVRQALIKDGWTITHDPLRLRLGARDLFVDLGAQPFLGAERGDVRIAVEIKGFGGPSDVKDLEDALGQFILYHDILGATDPGRILYLAIPQEAWLGVFAEPVGQLLLTNQRVRLLVFDGQSEEVVRWIP
jgi:hypothetical protein